MRRPAHMYAQRGLTVVTGLFVERRGVGGRCYAAVRSQVTSGGTTAATKRHPWSGRHDKRSETRGARDVTAAYQGEKATECGDASVYSRSWRAASLHDQPCPRADDGQPTLDPRAGEFSSETAAGRVRGSRVHGLRSAAGKGERANQRPH